MYCSLTYFSVMSISITLMTWFKRYMVDNCINLTNRVLTYNKKYCDAWENLSLGNPQDCWLIYPNLSRIWQVSREQRKQKLYWTHAIINTWLKVHYQHIQFCYKTFERTYFIHSLLKTNLKFSIDAQQTWCPCFCEYEGVLTIHITYFIFSKENYSIVYYIIDQSSLVYKI